MTVRVWDFSEEVWERFGGRPLSPSPEYTAKANQRTAMTRRRHTRDTVARQRLQCLLMHEQLTRALPPPPRPVYRRRERFSLPTLLGYALFPLSLCLFFVWHVAVVVAVTTSGVERPATVIDKDVVRTRPSTVYWVTYDYTDPQGQVRARSPASLTVWENLQRGSPLKVRTVRLLGLPRSEIVGSGAPLTDGSFYVLVAITVGCIALTVIVFASLLKPGRRQRAIIRNGTLTTGRIVGKSLRRPPKGQTTHTVAYEYLCPGRTQATMVVTAEEYARVHEGDAVPVIFVEGGKDKSLIYGFGEYAAADDRGDELVLAQRV